MFFDPYTGTPTTPSNAAFACWMFFTSCTLTRSVPAFSYTVKRGGWSHDRRFHIDAYALFNPFMVALM